MGTKIFFQDGSAIEISTEILEPGEMASAAYRKLLDFIEEEIKEMEDFIDENADELIDDDFDDLNDDDLEDIDDFEDDDIGFDDDELEDDEDDEEEEEWEEEDLDDDDTWR